MHAFPVRDIDPHRGLLQRRLRRCRAVSGKRPRECLAACARLRAERPPSSREPRPPLALAPRAPARPESVRCRALSPAASLPRRRHGSPGDPTNLVVFVDTFWVREDPFESGFIRFGINYSETEDAHRFR
jgi:hypothetical protein